MFARLLGAGFAEEAAAHAGKDVCGYRYVLNALITPAEWLEYPHWPSAHGFDRPPSSVVDEDRKNLAASGPVISVSLPSGAEMNVTPSPNAS